MKQEKESLTLEELSTAVSSLLAQHGCAGETPDHRVAPVPDERTIRYYTTLGILDRPTVSGRQARYGRRHLLQLLSIKALQARGMSLGDIQSRLYGRSDEELDVILSSMQREPAKARRLPPVVAWREVAVIPGLRLMIEEGWELPCEESELNRHIHAALAALLPTSGKGERSR